MFWNHVEASRQQERIQAGSIIAVTVNQSLLSPLKLEVDPNLQAVRNQEEIKTLDDFASFTDKLRTLEQQSEMPGTRGVSFRAEGCWGNRRGCQALTPWVNSHPSRSAGGQGPVCDVGAQACGPQPRSQSGLADGGEGLNREEKAGKTTSEYRAGTWGVRLGEESVPPFTSQRSPGRAREAFPKNLQDKLCQVTLTFGSCFLSLHKQRWLGPQRCARR
ncbi:Keratin, type II cytoskeletal 8 [Tupaia chinensis]|uniref:Keratin, type II cytoskeletal 8 n=1 Tax=Tupaia chinensis TaxID=246437 RepID=L9JP48_TUPCH|nr:Keratin, type II cytoskeletal 8 [Tupaia chinensis]